MSPNKALWEKGDFTRISASMRLSGRMDPCALLFSGESRLLLRFCRAFGRSNMRSTPSPKAVVARCEEQRRGRSKREAPPQGVGP
jgi:hypothetical protein